MAHYAQLDTNNIVTLVHVGREETEGDGNWEQYYNAKRTSYNTKGGVHYDQKLNAPSVDQSKAFRKNFAGIGYTYDESRDAFIPPQPYPSWTLNEETCLWNSPVPYPTDGEPYIWNEENQTWDLVTQ